MSQLLRRSASESGTLRPMGPIPVDGATAAGGRSFCLSSEPMQRQV